MLIHYIDNVNVEKEKEVYTKREFKNFNFQKSFLNCDILFNNRGKLVKIGRLVVENHSEGTVSQIFLFRP